MKRLVLASAVLLACVATVLSKGQYCLPIFAGAGSDALHALDPYLARAGRPDLFKYGPVWALLLAPLSLLPTLLAPWVWYLLNAWAFWKGSDIYARLISAEGLTLRSCLLLFPVFLSNGFYGQINGLLWLLMAIALGHHRMIAGLCLAAAAWMKVFPAFLALFAWRAGGRRRYTAGLLIGAILGVLLPVGLWGPQIFGSWAHTLKADAGAPHHKLGLLALLIQMRPFGVSDSLAQGANMLAALAFFGTLGGLAIFSRLDRRVLEALAFCSFLFFSHMTEPPTMALLAPAILVITRPGARLRASIPLFLLLVLLPSDLTPAAIKEAMGGQYAIKTYAIFCALLQLGLLVFLDRRRAPGLTRSPG